MERPQEFKSSRARNATVSGSEVAASMAATLGQCLRKHGIEETQADEIALDTLHQVRTMYGGQNLYFPREQIEKIAARDAEIFERFNSNELSVPEIAQKYEISLQWAYHIIRTVRVKRKAERDAARQVERATEHERWKREN